MTSTAADLKMQRTRRRRRTSRRSISALAVVATVSLLAAGIASAKVVELHAYNGSYPNGSFDGTGSVGAGTFGEGLVGMDINQATEDVYVGHQNGHIYQFDKNGAPKVFSALSPNTVINQYVERYGAVRVDNSGGASQGRIYAFPEYGALHAYLPTGAEFEENFPVSGLGDDCGADIAPNGNIWIAEWPGGIDEYSPTGQASTAGPAGGHISAPGTCNFAIDSEENFYVIPYGEPQVKKYNAAGELQTAELPGGVLDGDTSEGEPGEVAVDRSDDHVYVDHGGYVNEFDSSGTLLDKFGNADPSHSYPGLQGSQGIAVNEHTHVVYVGNNRNFGGATPHVDEFAPTGPVTIPDVTANAASGVTATTVTLNGVVNAAGVDTTECHFEWGLSTSYSHTAPCEVAGVPTNVFGASSGDHNVSVTLTGLSEGTTYHFRLSAANANGIASNSNDVTVTPSEPPVVSEENATNLNTDSASLNAEVDPAGGITTYHFEWGTEAGVYGNSAPSPDGQLATNSSVESISVAASGLTSGTTYHYRLVAHNDAGTSVGPDRTFTTFSAPSGTDSCPNAHVRQQTGSALLLDCRAYELVSAADTGGYNVESTLAADQSPYEGFPRAESPSRVLYGVHDGGIPGTDNPTNHGVDPYVATRGSDGWTTKYVGVPANDPFAGAPFSSVPSGADAGLDTFAFGGPGGCSPCFEGGYTGIPVRLPNGELVQGMTGSSNPGPGARSEGLVAKNLSADGSHLVFGSASKFAEGGNSNGDVSIYERDLSTGVTKVVSNTPAGTSLPCLQGAGNCHPPGDAAGIAELDISSDGSRVVVGQLVSTDAAGNHYYHLYMDVDGSPHTIDLTPGATDGALFDGMSADGSEVYFTTKDALSTATDQDTDTSADIYRADVNGSSATLTRVSTGEASTGNTDSCNPASDSSDTHWNAVGSTADCAAVAVAGGGGVAANGDIYFLSPEKLDTSEPHGQPVQDAPNLYLSKPGESPRYVATLESGLTAPASPPKRHVFSGSLGSFEDATGTAVAPNGDIYVLDMGVSPSQVERFSPSGTLLSTNDNNGNGFPSYEEGLPTQIAVDPSTGDLYVPNINYNSVERFNNAGVKLNSIYTGFSPTAVAVNPSNHNVYVASDYVHDEGIHVFTPTGEGVASYESGLSYARALAVDSIGRIYYSTVSRTNLYSSTGQLIRSVATGPAYGLTVDPADNSVYVDKGNEILHFTKSGTPAGPVEGGDLTAGRGIALNPAGRLYAVQSGHEGEVRYFEEEPAPDPLTDNPLVVHAVNDAGTRHTGDFQVTPDGGFAAFSSTLPLTGFTSLRHSEIYRYDAAENDLACVSCAPTGGAPSADTYLAPGGLDLSDDGRVFFSTANPLVLRDTNDNEDAYEWEDGTVQLISTGSSAFNSSLLSASANGTDAYFFTRDTLVPQDKNGTLTKIYDARAEGGFPYVPQPPACKASDECHGPGSQAPAPPGINTVTGSGNPVVQSARCKHGSVRRGGKCASRKHHKKKRRHHKHGGRSANADRGGVK